MNKTMFACVALLGLAGCMESKPAAETSQTNNAAIQVDTLFTKDGCTVYRFEDAGRSRYFVRCESGQTRTEWTESCGKNCTRPVEIPGA
jgi:hypothetical protein